MFFDEEVTNDKIERFRNILLKLRYPTSVYGFFCFNQSYSKLNPSYYNSKSAVIADSYMNHGTDFDLKEPGFSLTPQESADYFGPTMKSKEKGADALR